MRGREQRLRIERHAQARGDAPDYLAWHLDFVELDPKLEYVRNADLARHFQAGTGGRQIAQSATDRVTAEAITMVNFDDSRFLRTLAWVASLIHVRFLCRERAPA